eukprot:1509641-Pleurochrysis_carterae.AAC.1
MGDARAPRSAGCSKIYSAPAACAQFAFMNFGYVWQAHHVISVSYGWRSSVGGVSASIQAGYRERRTGW